MASGNQVAETRASSVQEVELLAQLKKNGRESREDATAILRSFVEIDKRMQRIEHHLLVMVIPIYIGIGLWALGMVLALIGVGIRAAG